MSKNRRELYSIDDAIAYIKEHKSNGIDCPCCGQLVKLYKRSFYDKQAVALIMLYRSPKEWVHSRAITERINIHGDIAKMRFWGLIEDQPNDNTEKRNSGVWRITDKGADFVEKKIVIPKYKYFFNQQVEGESEETITITDALGKKFNYEELMRS